MAGKSYPRLAVAYRIYPGISRSPFYHENDKLALSTVALRSFKRSLGNVPVKVFVLLDGCPPSYHKLFTTHFSSQELELIEYSGIGNYATFAEQIKILQQQDFADYVYLAEDDYLYVPDEFPKMVELISRFDDVDFVSPYDHPDYYSAFHHNHPCLVTFRAGHHWRTAASSCLTFLTRKTVLAETSPVWFTYSKRNRDSSMWATLTKDWVTSPLAITQNVLVNRHASQIGRRAWQNNWWQLLAARKYNLWTPLPAIATHFESTTLAPGRDWLALAKQIEKQ